jgi:short-subunit dehydrogenase
MEYGLLKIINFSRKMNIVITGASKGIGKATLKALFKEGGHRIFAIARSAFNLQQLKNELSEYNADSEMFGFSFDLSEKDYLPLIREIAAFFDFEKGQSVDILINNAGYLINKSLFDTSIDDWEKTFRVNTYAMLKLAQSLFPHFSTEKLTHIVNIGSMGGIQGTQKFPGLGAYSASKAAVNSLTESMAAEWHRYKVHCNCINPGSVQTEMLNEAFPGFVAPISADEFGEFLANFAVHHGALMNGRILQISLKS